MSPRELCPLKGVPCPPPQSPSICGAAHGLSHGHALRKARRAPRGRVRHTAPQLLRGDAARTGGLAPTLAPAGGIPGSTRGQLTWGWAPAAWTCRRFVNPFSSWTFLKGREGSVQSITGQPTSPGTERDRPQGPGTDTDAKGHCGQCQDGTPRPPHRTCPAQARGSKPRRSS